ncbi:MAG: spermidine synthase [Acidobacteriota bacterium]
MPASPPGLDPSSHPRAATGRPARLFLLAAFFASGFAALLYQTIWQRMLTLFGGADVQSVTIVVSAFMAGLGFGNLAGGHIADRLSVRGCLRGFAICELAIALFAFFSPTIYYDWLYVHVGAMALSRLTLGVIVFTVTLWPTFFMGLSLPLVSRLISGDVRQASRWIPTLYGWNTVGAAVGSLLSVIVLFPLVSFTAALRLGAVVSATCALFAILLANRWPQDPPVPSATTSAAPTRERSRSEFSVGLWIAIYALSGFLALSLEIVWFRVVGVTLKSNSATFGFILAVYLLGVGAGSLLIRHRWFSRVDPTTGFFAAQALAPLWAAAAVALLVGAVDRLGVAQPLWAFLATNNPLGPSAFRNGRALVLYAGVSLWLIFPSTVLMGMSFGLLQRAVQTDARLVGRRLGWLQSANIVGAMAGALLTGIYLLDWIGSAGTLRLVAGAGLIFVAFRLAARPAAWKSSGALAGIAIAVVALTPDNTLMWNRLHGTWPDRTISYEDRSGLVLLKPEPGTDRTRVFLAGISQSWLPYGSIHTALGALPVLMHPHPARVAVIGLASGDTTFAMGARPETSTIDNIEIMGAQHVALTRLAEQHRYPALSMLLDDARVVYHFTDGRTYLRRSTARYDVIEADALLPTSAYAGNLHSVEYFQLLRDSLAPGGFAVTWTPTERTRASMLRVFPYVMMFRWMAVGSLTPIVFDREAIQARLDVPFTARRFADGHVNVHAALELFLKEGAVPYGPDFDRSVLTDLNHDLFPQDEFNRPYSRDDTLTSALGN